MAMSRGLAMRSPGPLALGLVAAALRIGLCRFMPEEVPACAKFAPLERREPAICGLYERVVAGAGFEPAKAEPLRLQRNPVDRLGIPPGRSNAHSRRRRQVSSTSPRM